MILSQVFKSHDGVQKRVAFENAHSKTHRFVAVRFLHGILDIGPVDRAVFDQYEWKIQKLKK